MKTVTLLLCLFAVTASYSQNDSFSVFGLPEMKIRQKENGKTITYIFENTLNKFTLTPGSLLLDTLRFKYKVDLKDISRISFHNGSNFWNAAGITGSVGFVLGFLAFGFFDFNERPVFHVNQAILGGVISALPFALVGGLIGALTYNYDDYDIHKLNELQKYKKLKVLFRTYRVKR